MKNQLTRLLCFWMLLTGALSLHGAPIPDPLISNDDFEATAPPAEGFTYVSNGGCVPVTIQFYSQLNGPSYSWDFGDMGTSTDCNPVHTYTTPGTYTVTLTATGGTYTTTITVGAPPVVTFTGDSTGCQNDVLMYTATSTIPAASYSWSADGGTVTASTAGTATITWNSFGVNYITYSITTAAGCTKTFRYKVKVIPPPMVNLPCCDKRQDEGFKRNSDGKEGVPGGSEPCSVCAGSYSCYTASIDPLFGVAAEYNWSWAITNGTIISISPDSTNVCVIWGTSGTGTISLTSTHKIYGCQTVKECDVLINPGITPVFSVTGNCISSPVVFDASATTPLTSVTSYFWEFGDGYTETTSAPTASHQYDFTGTYTATLTITTVEGCTYKVDQTFNVISGTKPEIECPGTACEGGRQCYSTALVGGATYVWTIVGDDPGLRTFSASGEEVCVTWGAGPVGSVSVTVVGGGYTCTNTATEVIPIVGTNIPISGPDYVCQSSFFEQVSTTNYSGACYKWKINGTPQASTVNTLNFNPQAFSSPLNIEVEVDFGLGCCSGSGTKSIIALPEYVLNNYTTNVCIGSSNTYNLIFPVGTPTNPVSWSVEGGTITSSTSSSVTITWNTAGVGTITAGNNSPSEYCNDGTNNSWNVNVFDKATGDDIAGAAVVCPSTTYSYYHAYENPTGSATVSVSPAGATVSAGTYSSDITFPNVAVPTTYTVSVTYNHSSIAACGTTKTYDVEVIPAAIPTFTIPPGNVCEGDVVTYTCAMPDSQYYDWSVIGGSIVSETYSAGTLTIQVQWNSTVTSSITVTNNACNTSNTQPIVVNGKPVVIIDQSSISCTSTSVTLSVAPVWTSYSWSSGPTGPTASVTTPGIYTVTVSNGVCSNTGSTNVAVVTPAPPVINSFTVTSSGVYCPKYQQICPNITLGSGTIDSYSWSFSGFNTTSSTATCPSVALPSTSGLNTGTWTLTVTDSYGCTHSLNGSLTDSCTLPTGGGPGTGCTPTATFNITGYDPCTGLFSTTGTNVSSVFWDFGDGTQGTGLAPTHLYSSACNKTVTCTVRDTGNCPTVFTFNISVPYVMTDAEITVANAACIGANTLTVNGISVCAGSGLTPSYSWSITPLGGGPAVYTGVSASPTLNVGTILAIPDGDFTATVQVTISGCTKTATVNFNKGGLTAYFVSCGGCAGSPLTFIDQSVPYNDPIIKWEWSFTGPSTVNSFLQNPTVTFATPGTYTATLIVTDNDVCKDTFTTTIVIQPPFLPGNILVNGTSTAAGTVVDICPEASTTLTAPSGAGYTYIWSTGDNTVTTSVTEPGEYYVTVFNANNCAAKIGPIIFRYKPAPEAIIQPVGNECSSRLLRAFLGTGYTYNWSYPVSATSTQPYIYMNTGGSVTLTVNNLHGCASTTTQSFSVNPSPFASVNYAPQPFCPGNTVTLTGTPSGGTPPYTHLWNNGNATTAFPTSTPGLYTYTVTDANGCSRSASLNLQPRLPNGLDKLPFGCYDVCDAVTFCAGVTIPFGWNAQWYNGATPFGPVITAGNSASTTFTASGTYTLHYIPTNPSNCAAVSKAIVINFVTLPTFTISSSSVPPVICSGSGQTITLTASPQSPMYNYNWYLNGTLVGTGYTFTAADSGTYVLEVSESECCKRTVTFTITEELCCFENAGVPFTPILSDITISSNEFWFDKYYIDAVVTVTSNAELDLTNVDCVFGPNGTIVMEDESFFRCNNSVLRPCAKEDIWQGLYFRNNSSGWLNTTTVKNAIVAVNIQSNSRGVRLTDNSFIKCQTSVSIRNSENQQSISGNTFETDDVYLDYPVNPNEYWAIKINNSNLDGLIAQNEFRHVRPQKGNNRYFGIYNERSNFTASQNRFDDMFRAIDVNENTNVVAIEDNKIKINNLKEEYDSYQIRITNCTSPVLVYENDMDNGLADNSNAGAIYLEETFRTHIKDNVINGFFSGIFGVSTQNVHITSNTVTSSVVTAISLSESRESIVSCNTVNSMATNDNQPSGKFGILDLGSDGSANIYSNCVFNMHTAIYLDGDGEVPNTINNYMYNYRDNGIYINGYSGGSIGNPGGATDAGRNTFMSNNGAAGSTIDINSTVPIINEGGNFGIQITNNVVSTTSTDRYYSTAACGQQIQGTYRNNQLDKYNICDIYNLEEWVFKDGEGKFQLKDPKGKVTSGTIDEMLSTKNTEVLGMITAKMQADKATAQATGDEVLKSKIDKNLAARILVDNSLVLNEPQMATTFLQAKELSTIDNDLREVLATRIAISTTAFTGAHKQAMKAIDDKNNSFSSLARDIVQANAGNHDYKFKKATSPEVKEATNKLLRLSNSLLVYPVPATQSVTAEYSVSDAKVTAVKVISIIGAEVANFEYTIQAGTVDIDVSTLAAGMYTIVLVTDDDTKPSMTGRFIKQ